MKRNMQVLFGLVASEEVRLEVSVGKLNIYSCLLTKVHTKCYSGNLRTTHCLGDLGDIKTNLKVIECGNVDWIHLAQKLVAGSCERYNELSGSIKGMEFINNLSDY
jgi:hypothetical protein